LTQGALREKAAAGPHHAKSADEALSALGTAAQGLSETEARARLERFGPNALPHKAPPGPAAIFLRQFLSPFIYILLAAAALSAFLRDWADAGFIGVVLFLNAVIGTVQEYSAERSAEALKKLVSQRARVLRDGAAADVPAERVVPGDVVLLETGDKVPADLRLLSAEGLEADESLLTGESLPVAKDARAVLPEGAPVGDRVNSAFAGTLVSRGRASGVAAHTGARTQLGSLARGLEGEAGIPPLLARMQRFTYAVGGVVLAAVALVFAVEFLRGTPWRDVFLLSVALAVSAIPEGMPVAITVALSISARRMAKRNVVVRRLAAVEALGSCTYIAADKTGTLTRNELSVKRLVLPGLEPWEVAGPGRSPVGEVLPLTGAAAPGAPALLARFARAVGTCNEASMEKRGDEWIGRGDPVDVTLLALAGKAGAGWKPGASLARIPYESERKFSAVLAAEDGGARAFVKGAPEKVLPMCARAAATGGEEPIDPAALEREAEALARAGYRVLAVADGKFPSDAAAGFTEDRLAGLVFLGFAGMTDPLRSEAKDAVARCGRAGIRVAMVTGDHPATALSIARELGLAESADQVVTGPRLARAEEEGSGAVEALAARARVFARVEPGQKLVIVRALQALGHFVAVTGDGANDAPALKAAQVGVAMGGRGTDVARESSSLLLTDDNFASIAAGVEEGRVAYANVRKVVFLLASTGGAELVIFFLALAAGLPLPLLAAQLLWLNLVTNGIQDVSLAFEPAEGGEMDRPPRRPSEPVFDRVMVERSVLAASVMGLAVFGMYRGWIAAGWTVEAARNSALLLMVLFENVHVLTGCRSERRSVLAHNPLGNPLLFIGTAAAQLLHIGAMYTPGLREVLGVAPVSAGHWLELLGMTLVLPAVMEVQKAFLRRREARP
jgi:P-type Ca2+ transporter type 2C